MSANFDGRLIFDTQIDRSGFEGGIEKLKSTATMATAAIGAAIVGFGVYATKVGSEFEASMSKVEAISGATAEDMQLLTDKAKAMGASTKFSASESADALQYMAMAGWKTNDMMDGLGGIMNLAAASGEDLATTSDIVTDALTGFGLTAADSGHFADVLAAASSNANTNVAMMGETFKYAAPLAGALGYSVEDISVAIGLMANAGIKGGEAGTALRATLTRLVKPPKDAAAAMQALGLTVTNADGSMKPFRETMDDLRSAFDGLSESQQAEYAAALAGQEAMSGLLAIVNASPADYEKLQGAIDHANGSAEEMAAIMQDNLQGQFTLMKSALEGLGISIYESFETPLKNIVSAAADYLGRLNNTFEEYGYQGLLNVWRGILGEMLQAVADEGPQMIASATDLIIGFLDTIGGNSDNIAEAGVEIVSALAKAATEVIPKLAEVALKLIVSFVQYIAQNLDKLGPVALLLIQTFATGILLNGTKLIGVAGELIMKMLGRFKSDIASKMPAIGKSIVTGLLNGIKSSSSWLLNNIRSWCGSILNGIKGFFGIHSPSTVFRDEVGANLALGVGEGFTSEYGTVAEKMKAVIDQETESLSVTLSVDKGNLIAAPADVSGDVSIPVTIYYQSTGSEDVDAKRLGRKLGQEVDKSMRSKGVK